jgi:hypothetical protein
MSIQIRITSTSKGYHPSSEWQRFDEHTHYVADAEELKEWLAEHYGKCKHVPMFRDKKNGPPVRCGYVYGFRAGDAITRWLQQDWVSFYEITPLEQPANL